MNHSTTWQNKISLLGEDAEEKKSVIYADKTDRQLTDLVLAGEEYAFEHIFDRYKRLVATVASRYFQRPEQIEEIIQISFTKVYFELGNFRGENEFSLAAWLGRITTNACLDFLRSQKRKPESLNCELTESETNILFADTAQENKSVEDLTIDRDLAEKLLSNLRVEDRAILQMLYAEEMSVVEMVKATGWSSSKIKIRAHRARHALNKILKKFV